MEQSTQDSHLRSLLKGISWRALGTLVTILLSWIFTRDMEIAAAIGATEVLTKVGLFYFHERVWQLVPDERISRPIKTIQSMIRPRNGRKDQLG